MGSKTSKLKDQIAKGILSGMGTVGLQLMDEKKGSLPPESTEPDSVITALSQPASDSLSMPETKTESEESSVAIEDSPSATLPSHPRSDLVSPNQSQSTCGSLTTPESYSDMPTLPESVCGGPSMTDHDLLRLMKDYLNREVPVQDRLWTGAGAKGLNKFKKIEGKIPEELVDEIRRLKGPVTHHLERAVRLYLAVLKA